VPPAAALELRPILGTGGQLDLSGIEAGLPVDHDDVAALVMICVRRGRRSHRAEAGEVRERAALGKPIALEC